MERRGRCPEQDVGRGHADNDRFYDQGGDGVSEFLIVVQNVANLQTSDILF